ncbi:MAG: M20 family peptidase [Leptolyngbya sp. PLA2]|nr:M20 family peptidase [Leptolyngbya sp. PL-A2]MCQ3941368.1 hypothetical protein [cyanobacterium CYA1]MCZ7632911.1 M20/M25/M40 family metallo-hydrolase [Phycisphaerales bacterium]MDL1904479.1 M20/M25/M40 family metallo-hydrolase [Synechococcales cyanobacterium CNB]GIK19015.1 MAG: hypothetical protein BroJett004_11790 [Planctomycetota bacterium]
MPTLGAAGLSEREHALCRAVERRRDDLLADLRLHVGLPTGGNNAAALDETRERLTDRLRAIGATVELIPGDPRPDWLYGQSGSGPIPPTAVCRKRSKRGDAPRVLLVGHLDTVHDPAGPFRELTVGADGRTATGPGCVDMKGGLVILVAALESLVESGIDADWTVVFNSDEETGSYHSDAVLAAEAVKHDAGLVVEPALPGGALAVERMGSGQFCLRTYGRSAHVGRDFTSGVSAVTALARCLIEVAEMADAERGMITNVGPLEGGTVTNAVPDRARAWGNVRFSTPASAAALGSRLDALATGSDAMPRVEVLRSFNRPAKPLTPGTSALAELARTAAQALGQSLPFTKTGGVCDGNQLQACGLPTIDTLGVRGGGLHTPEEWIELASLVERCQLLAVVVSRLSEGRLKV